MKILGEEAASLREAPLPPDPSLPKSGWRLAGVDSSSLVPPEGCARFPASRLWSRRLTEPPRPSNYRPRRGRRFPTGERKAARRAPSFGRARRHEIPPPQRQNPPWLLPQKELSCAPAHDGGYAPSSTPSIVFLLYFSLHKFLKSVYLKHKGTKEPSAKNALRGYALFPLPKPLLLGCNP